MTQEQPPLKEIVENVKADVMAVPLRERAQTILLTTGILAFGFMLGAHYMAAHTFATLPPLHRVPEYRPLQETYRTVMDVGMFVAGGCLVTGVALDARRRDPE